MVEIVYISLAVCFAGAVVLWCLKHLLILKKDSAYLLSKMDVDRVIGITSVLALAFMWFSISLSFTLYNKWILQEWHTGFTFPIIISTIHMIMKYVITRLWSFSAWAPEIVPSSASDYGLLVIPVGIFTVADIVLSNQSIVLLPLSMYTTIKSASVIFTFLWAVMLDLEKFRWRLFFCVVAITSGIGMAVFSSGKLDDVGISLAVGACVISALRWVLLQVLARREPQCADSMIMLFKFSPVCAAFAIPFALVMEVPPLTNAPIYRDTIALEETIGMCMLGGVISFFLLVVELQLLNETSSLTLGVIGQMKEIMQICIGMVLFKDHLTLISGLGIAGSIAATYYYKVLKMEITAEHRAAEEGYQAAQMNENAKYNALLDESVHNQLGARMEKKSIEMSHMSKS